MTDNERNERIDAMLYDLVAEMVAEGLVQDEIAGWRTLIFKGFDALPEHLCREHLRSDLTRIQGYLSDDIAQLSPN